MSKWQEAVESKDVSRIKSALQELFELKDDQALMAIHPAKLVAMKDYFEKEQVVSIVEVLLRPNNLGQDLVFFDIANKLLSMGAPMPELHRNRESFASTSDYLQHLATDDHDLFIALHNDPSIINLQGEDGKTILHHAASIGLVMASDSACLIHHQLFSSPLVDFTIQDNEGNTPVHIAAHYCKEPVTCRYIFPNYVRAAAEKGFNFDTLNKQGQAVIHIATRNAYEYWLTGRDNTVGRLLHAAKDHINVNVLSSSGSTAFFYAVNWMYLKEANSLLDAGADPTLCSKPDRDPFKMINERIDSKKIYIDLIKAYQAGTLREFMKHEQNVKLLVEAFKAEYEQQPDSGELEPFAEELAQSSAEKLDALQATIDALENLKCRMQSIVFTKAQERDDKFPFWSRTADSKAWDVVDTQTFDHDRAGPGYGF